MVIRIATVAFFGALFYLGVLRLPHILGYLQAQRKGLDFVGKNEIAEYGDIDTLVVPEKAVKDEEGEVEAGAIEIITMVGRAGVDAVLVTDKNEKAGDELARRLGAVRCFYETSDSFAAVKCLEEEGKKVLYAEDLLAAEEAIELGKAVRKTAMRNAAWTVLCGISGFVTVESAGVIIFGILNLAAVAISSLKIRKY